MSDRVVLAGLDFFAYHGVSPAERELGQRFVVDVALSLDTRGAGTNDDLARSVDYAAVYTTVRDVVQGEPRKLIETVAEQIAAALLQRFPAAEAVEVAVNKPAAPIAGAVVRRVAVEITRRRDGSA